MTSHQTPQKRKEQYLALKKKRSVKCSSCGNEKSLYSKRCMKCLSSLRKQGIIKSGKEFLGAESHWNWQGGKTDLTIKIRASKEYRLWREAVFKRDNWTCIWCGYRGKKLNADHIKPFSLFPELRFALDNGRTLCENCHRKTDTFGINMRFYKIQNRNEKK